MSKVIITDITEGATTDVSDVTPTVSSWNASTVGPENVRDEALDERMFAPETAAIVGDFLEYSYSYSFDDSIATYQSFKGVNDPLNRTIMIGPIRYQESESDLIVRFSAGLIMPISSATAVGSDPKMTLRYRLVWNLRSEGNPPTAVSDWSSPDGVFSHTRRQVGLSPYPRCAIGSTRYRNNITTTLLLNQDTPGQKPRPYGSERLWIALQIQKVEFEMKPDFSGRATTGTGAKFTLANINLNCAHYKR